MTQSADDWSDWLGPNTIKEDVLGKKGTVLLSVDGRLSWVISKRVCTDRQLRDLGLKIVGTGAKPRKVIPFDQAWNPSDDEGDK